MDYLLDKNIKKVIKEELGLDERLDEALVAQKKPFDLKTEYLSGGNKKNHIKLYNQYVEDFNKISAKLDAADRNKPSSNHSEFRQLKIDETYNMNAAYLHELYFANVSDLNSEITMDSLSYIRLYGVLLLFAMWLGSYIFKYLHSKIHEYFYRFALTARTSRILPCYSNGCLATCLL
jgi:hypothetical protein